MKPYRYEHNHDRTPDAPSWSHWVWIALFVLCLYIIPTIAW